MLMNIWSLYLVTFIYPGTVEHTCVFCFTSTCIQHLGAAQYKTNRLYGMSSILGINTLSISQLERSKTALIAMKDK